MATDAKNYWIVGSSYGGIDDQKDRFLENGIWEVHNPGELDKQRVRSMQPGDHIAIKSTFTQKKDLPFNNNSEPVSVLRIKARGTVTSNPGDGNRVYVDWDTNFEQRDWYFFTFRAIIWLPQKDMDEAQQLIRFIWNDEPQDYDWFLAQPYWASRYAPSQSGECAQKVWIEKTIVRGRRDREEGEHALGRALWSPQKSKSGGDIYANMRAVRPGDIVLHLTDNRGFSGISIAAKAADDSFGGILDSDWHGACYRIELRDYLDLEPPLLREQLLSAEPFAAQLKELIESGVKGLFFNSKLELNQGAYLTEAMPTLVSIINNAYFEAAGKHLPYIGAHEASEPTTATIAEPYSIEDALETLFLDKEEVEEIILLWRAKRNIVLQGPPGVGKSFAAQKLAFALMEKADPDRVGFVQFHQSYSYEDFVEGFRPTDKGFELKAGKFVQFCRKAEADQDNDYVFVIDEINRGNLSKILGELMLLIEGDKRGPGWSMQLASGKVAFHVPKNVYVMGLMNTADRSLAVVDYALRRRFAFIDLKPKIGSAKFAEHLSANGLAGILEHLVTQVSAVNQEIISDTLNLGPGFAIGHSFFCGKPLPSETDKSWFRRIVKTEIGPLLREYWFDAPQRANQWEARLLEGI